MKNAKLLFFTLLLAINSSVFAQTKTPSCTPSTVNNYVPCDAGYSGQKFKTTTITCPAEWPSGLVSTTSTYNTSQCVKATTSSAVDRTCELTPAACAPQPKSPGCPAGKHWTLTGATVAHCVDNDPVCPWGTSLTHDGKGNPSCVANTCPSNQVLQSDGISCACPAGTAWNGGSCVPLPPPCTPSVTKGGNVACDAGYTGFKFGVTTTSCPGNVATFAWNTSGCTPTCSPSVVNGGNIACDTGFTGSKHLVTTTTCPGNTTSSYWDTSACTPIPPPPPVCPAATTTTGSCPDPINYTGHITTTTTYSGSSCAMNTTTDLSMCTLKIPTQSCPNGATDWPTCTLTVTYICTFNASSYTNTATKIYVDAGSNLNVSPAPGRIFTPMNPGFGGHGAGWDNSYDAPNYICSYGGN